MEYYELLPDVYRIQAGVGSDGEIFGGLFLDDDPGVLIGCSGGSRFVSAFRELIEDLKFNDDIRVYLPVVTYHEITTASLLKDQLPNVTFYVHTDIIDEFQYPRENFMVNRYFSTNTAEKFFSKNLPREISDVIAFDKSASLETKHTKILIIPFDGPHKGHSFIYSRDHKLLCSGMILGRTSDPRKYYIDRSGSIFQYKNALSFLEKARSEIIFPIYDEPEFSSDLKFKSQNVRDALDNDMKNILDLCSSKFKTLEELTGEYLKLYGEKNNSEPYDLVDLNELRVYQYLQQFIEDKLVTLQEDQYRLN